MEKISEHIDNLILQYSKNKLSTEEEAELLEWIGISNDNKSYFRDQVVILKTLQAENISFEHHFKPEKITEKQITKRFTLKKNWISFVASITVLLIISGLLMRYHTTEMEILASEQRPRTFQLEDASSITIGLNSRLVKPKKFGRKNREVNLFGNARFKISKETSRPFIIHAGNITVKVLGTSFDIKMDTLKNTVEVFVYEGLVAVSTKYQPQPTLLKKNGQLIIRQNGNIVNKIDVKKELEYKRMSSALIFNATSMREVAEKLGERYHATFIIKDDKINKFTLTTKIDKQTKEEILIMLELTLNLSIESRNDSIFLSRKN